MVDRNYLVYLQSHNPVLVGVEGLEPPKVVRPTRLQRVAIAALPYTHSYVTNYGSRDDSGYNIEDM